MPLFRLPVQHREPRLEVAMSRLVEFALLLDEFRLFLRQVRWWLERLEIRFRRKPCDPRPQCRVPGIPFLVRRREALVVDAHQGLALADDLAWLDEYLRDDAALQVLHDLYPARRHDLA